MNLTAFRRSLVLVGLLSVGFFFHASAGEPPKPKSSTPAKTKATAPKAGCNRSPDWAV